jgi:hypothetical protein
MSEPNTRSRRVAMRLARRETPFKEGAASLDDSSTLFPMNNYNLYQTESSRNGILQPGSNKK